MIMGTIEIERGRKFDKLRTVMADDERKKYNDLHTYLQT